MIFAVQIFSLWSIIFITVSKRNQPSHIGNVHTHIEK